MKEGPLYSLLNLILKISLSGVGESILGTGARGKFVFQIKAKPLLCKLHSHLLKGPSAVRLAM